MDNLYSRQGLKDQFTLDDCKSESEALVWCLPPGLLLKEMGRLHS